MSGDNLDSAINDIYYHQNEYGGGQGDHHNQDNLGQQYAPGAQNVEHKKHSASSGWNNFTHKTKEAFDKDNMKASFVDAGQKIKGAFQKLGDKMKGNK